MIAILKDNESSEHIYILQETNPKKLVSLVSQNVFDTQNVVSASHCQSGKGDLLYDIKKEKIEWIKQGAKGGRSKRKTSNKRKGTKKIKTKVKKSKLREK
jgi:hypothetical protein